jgi:hypothetical protein
LQKSIRMIKSDKKVAALARDLKNPDISIVIAAIDLLRDTEPFEGAISILIDHYDNCIEKRIKQSISGFLNDLKDTGAKKEIIDSVRLARKEDTVSMIISSCWQSGLDYSDRIDDFIEFFMMSNYDIAFECLTVIEHSVEKIDLKKKKIIINSLKAKISSQSTEKTALVNELVNVLS